MWFVNENIWEKSMDMHQWLMKRLKKNNKMRNVKCIVRANEQTKTKMKRGKIWYISD